MIAIKHDCNKTNRPVPDNIAANTRGFIYLCLGGKWLHGRLSKEIHEDGWTTDDGPRHRHTSASVRIPAFHSPGAASLSIGSSSLGDSEASLRRFNSQQIPVHGHGCVHTYLQFRGRKTRSSLINSAGPLHIRLSLVTPSRALSPRFVDAPCRSGTDWTAFRFLQQVDEELSKPPCWESGSPSWPSSVSK